MFCINVILHNHYELTNNLIISIYLFQNLPGFVNSFLRGCEDKPLSLVSKLGQVSDL